MSLRWTARSDTSYLREHEHGGRHFGAWRYHPWLIVCSLECGSAELDRCSVEQVAAYG